MLFPFSSCACLISVETFLCMFFTDQLSEFLRIARSTLYYADFLPVASNLLKRMINQGGSKVKLLQQISKAVQRHPNAFKTFSKKGKEIVDDLSN